MSDILSALEKINLQPSTPVQQTNEKLYFESVNDIVSKVAYLIGVNEIRFNSNFSRTIYEDLEKNKDYKSIRLLSQLRTLIFRNFSSIHSRIIYDMSNLDRMPDIIDPNIIRQLRAFGFEIIKANYKLNDYIIDINTLIKNNINKCKGIFPIWIEWEYIKELFIIPRVEAKDVIKNTGTKFTSNSLYYPFQMWVNFNINEYTGNILYNDEKFVELLYNAHGKTFEDKSKLRDATEEIKNDFYNFIDEGENIEIIIDCENANVFKVYSMLDRLKQESVQKIKKILLFDDEHTSTAWKLLNKFVSVEIEHKIVKRIKENKSLVDMSLAVGACKDHYTKNIDSFVLISSDSDYWGLISGLQECRFLVVVEKDNVSQLILDAFSARNIPYCYIDNFCSGSIEALQTNALLVEMNQELKEYTTIDINDIFSTALENTRVEFSPDEKNNFLKKYGKKFAVERAGDKMWISII